MKLSFELTVAQADEIYQAERRKRTEGDVQSALHERFGLAVELSEEEFNKAVDKALVIQDNDIYYVDMAEQAINEVLAERPKKPELPKNDLLNDTLKKIGLETHQYFRIADDEFAADDFYIDSFGDVYVVNGDPAFEAIDHEQDEPHDYLTLGRILTQYPDKIIPREDVLEVNEQ